MSAFKLFEYRGLSLSVAALSTVFVAKIYAQDPASLVAPATPEACVALEANADRLACYDALFKIPEAEKTPLISERQAAQALAPVPETLKEKIAVGVSNLFSFDVP